MYICYIYNVMFLLSYSPNQCSFRSPGGVGRGLHSIGAPKPMRGNWPLWPSGVLPWATGRTGKDGQRTTTATTIPQLQKLQSLQKLQNINHGK